MTPLNLFNSTILVLWVTYLVPRSLKNEDKWTLRISGAVILAAEITLCLIWAKRDFPVNLLAAFAIFLFALMGGYVAHHFYQKINGDDK